MIQTDQDSVSGPIMYGRYFDKILTSLPPDFFFYKVEVILGSS